MQLLNKNIMKDINLNSDVVVYGSTPAGICAAIRCAREGYKTTLVSVGPKVGGTLSGGLSYTDTLMVKPRSPILDEYVMHVRNYYHEKYGSDSENYAACENGYISEPHVAEYILEKLLSAERNLEVIRGWKLDSVERRMRSITAIRLSTFGDIGQCRLAGKVYIDCSYEGDLMGFAGADYRVGKESREEFSEQFAGEIYVCSDTSQYYPREAVGTSDRKSSPKQRGPLDVPPDIRSGELDLVPHPCGMTEFHSRSTGEGDSSIQAYNYRLCLTCDPENSVLAGKPESYDRENYRKRIDFIKKAAEEGKNPLPGPTSVYFCLRKIPNNKVDMNGADMPGANWDYPDGDWGIRNKIAKEHRDYALGFLYTMQHDPELPDDFKEEALKWNLPKDEFQDTGHFPHELYVREARRMNGRYVFREQDARYAHGIHRTPIHPDSIGIAEYPMDSHATGTGGGFYASEITRPSQIPIRSILPKEIDNMIVPVCVSSTHVAFGSIRVEPCWMQLGESAGFIAAFSIENYTLPGHIKTDELLIRLAEKRMTLSFFNDIDVGMSEDWVAAIQFLGTKGLFPSYNSRPHEMMSQREADLWIKHYGMILAGNANCMKIAREIYAILSNNTTEVLGEATMEYFMQGLLVQENYWIGKSIKSNFQSGAPITRANAAIILFDKLKALITNSNAL